MLGILLSPRLETGMKIHQLEHEFDIPMENDMGEELNQMCNLSDYVEELGIEKGIERGIEKHLSQQVKKKLAKGKSNKYNSRKAEYSGYDMNTRNIFCFIGMYHLEFR